MDRQRNGKPNRPQGYHSQLLEAIRLYLPHRGLPLCTEDRRVRWTDRLLTIVSVLRVWWDASTARDAFAGAREVAASMYRTRRRPGRHLAGFLGALRKGTRRLLGQLVPALRTASEAVAGPAWRWRQWVLMAADGSRIDCPRTVSNEEAFGCGGRKKTGPQQFLTTVFHVATGLIWDWRRGRADASERGHLREMLPGLPERTLLLADAGFTGYALLRSVLAQGHDFLIRVGGNVTLLQRLGYHVREYDGIVYLWPQAKRTSAPLVLRLIRVTDGSRSRCLLTNVLQEARLSDAQAAELYCRRWVVEVCFRSLKQTMARRKMLSTSAENAKVELDWAMVGLWLLGLMGAGEVRSADQGRISIAQVLRAVRVWMRRQTGRPSAGGLGGRFRKAVVDRYVRHGSKAARAWPHKKRPRPPGTPNVRMATELEILEAKELTSETKAA